MNVQNTQSKKLNVLFLCTGNSCRSQMSEAWAKSLKSDVIEAYSAGIETHGMNPYAIQVMQEAGVEMNTHASKHVDDIAHIPFDYVIAVCSHAADNCPTQFKNARVVKQYFDDPPGLTKNTTDENERLNTYRRVRDEIKDFILSLPETLPC